MSIDSLLTGIVKHTTIIVVVVRVQKSLRVIRTVSLSITPSNKTTSRGTLKGWRQPLF